ncbi:MAG TPA: hypothetical protein VJB89_00225 [Candidatus Nanoarchaeia archaeon]|nr:hypothetical protein [Candidatus Nanoarchaeia archaeon]
MNQYILGGWWFNSKDPGDQSYKDFILVRPDNIGCLSNGSCCYVYGKVDIHEIVYVGSKPLKVRGNLTVLEGNVKEFFIADKHPPIYPDGFVMFPYCFLSKLLEQRLVGS